MARANSQTPPRKSMAANTPREKGSAGVPTTRNIDPWLQRACDAYDVSTSFIENNYRADWENSTRHFQNKHASDSKYLKPQYTYRTKHFRPKSRAMVRNNETAIAGAFFSQLDVVSVEAMDEKDPLNAASAGVRHFLLNHRLTETIPWFQTCIGAAQDGHIYGVIGSKQYWLSEYDSAIEDVTGPDGQATLNEDGTPAQRKVKTKRVDRPDIKLYPIENLRFSPAADWTDVVESSPYFIALESMTINEVKQRMQAGDFETIDDATLLNARNSSFEPIRKAREADKEDATDPRFNSALSDLDLVWVHEVFLRIDGKDMQFYTLGTQALLTKPKPVGKVYLHGIRPYRIGTCMLEAHRAIPDAPVHLMKGLQKETNDISNTRSDNVKLVLQKRYLVRRGKQVDVRSLVQNAPGSATLVTDIEKDVLPLEFNDVTRSAYEEQDRVNVDTDELMGSFSQSSVASNRKLNETVGGMSMLRQSANSLTQYMIRVFSETWVEPVLHQLDLLNQHYETDIELLALMARKAGWTEKYQIDLMQLSEEQIEAVLTMPCTVNVNVSNSAMDPMIRLDQFITMLMKYAEFCQMAPADIDRQAVKETMFAFMGFKDARRFSIDDKNMSPEAQQLKAQFDQQMQQAMQEIAKLKGGHDIKMMEAQAKIELEKTKLALEMQMEQDKLAAELHQAQEANAVKLQIMREESHMKLVIMEEQGNADLALSEKKLEHEGHHAARELHASTLLEVRAQDAAHALEQRRLEHDTETARDKNRQATDVAREKVSQTTDVARDKVKQGSEVAREKVTQGTAVAREKVKQGTAVAREKNTQDAKTKAQELRASGQGGSEIAVIKRQLEQDRKSREKLTSTILELIAGQGGKGKAIATQLKRRLNA